MSTTVQALPSCPDDLATELANGRPILVVARNSTSGSHDGRRLAADDALEALRALNRQGVVDVTKIAPSREQIMDGLHNSKEVINRPFGVWRYYRWASPDNRVQLLVCVGSGSLTDEAGVQPHMEYVRNEVVKVKPVLLWAKAFDRLGRDGAGGAMIGAALSAQSQRGHLTFLGWKERGLMPIEGIFDLEMVIHGRQGGQQAKQLKNNSRDAMRVQTGERMVNGRVAFALHIVVPPGLALARRLNDKGGRGSGIAYLDCARYRPKQEEVHGPLPVVLDVRGEPVDQVENVKWALHELAVGRSALDVAAELHNRGFSFMSLRRRKGHSAVVRDAMKPRDPKYARSVITSILRHLEFYKTGRLETVTGGQTVQIEGMSPPGGWLTDEDAAKLDARLGQPTRRPAAMLLLSGLPARFGEGSLTLYARDASHDSSGEHVSDPRYRLVTDAGEPAGFSLTHEVLIASIVAGIVDALTTRSVPLRLVPCSEAASLTGLRARIDAAQQTVRTLEQESERLVRKLGRELLDDDPLVPLLRADFDRLREEELPAAAAALKTAEQEHRAAVREQAERASRASLDSVLQLVASLRDPRSEQARQLLLDMITDFEVRAPDDTGRIRWVGTLTLSSGGASIEVPFSGQQRERRRSAPSALDLATRLLEGRSIAGEFVGRGANGTTRSRADRAEIMRHAGLPEHMVWLTRVHDEALVLAYMARYSQHPEAPSWESVGARLSAVFGDVQQLAAALDRQVQDKKGLEAPDWIEGRSKVETDALIQAAVSATPSRPARSLGGAKGSSSRRCLAEWRGEPDGRSLKACHNCGSYRRCRLVINEPIGYVCLDCRTDSTGVAYPAERFDRYIAFPDRWRSAGVALHQQEEAVGSIRSKKQPQLARSLPLKAKQAIGRDYRDGMLLRHIIKKHGLRNAHDVYMVINELKIPKRAAKAA